MKPPARHQTSAARCYGNPVPVNPSAPGRTPPAWRGSFGNTVALVDGVTLQRMCAELGRNNGLAADFLLRRSGGARVMVSLSTSGNGPWYGV